MERPETLVTQDKQNDFEYVLGGEVLVFEFVNETSSSRSRAAAR